MDIADKVLAEAAGQSPGLRSTQEHGRYASRVRITDAGQSSFAGMTGVVTRVEPGPHGTVVVRFGSYAVPVPFAASEIEVIR